MLPDYAQHTFDGSYTHAGLLDTVTGEIWIPPWQALGGHAALMADGNTDRYFKFQLYLANQAPPKARETALEPTDAHLFVQYITDWYYSKQILIDINSAECAEAIAEQERLERRVVAFYTSCELSYGIQIHKTLWMTGGRPQRLYATSRIDPA